MDEDQCYGLMAVRCTQQAIETYVGTECNGLEASSYPGDVFHQIKKDIPKELKNHLLKICLKGRNKMHHDKWVFHLKKEERQPFKDSFLLVMHTLCPNWKIVHVNNEQGR